MSSLSELIELVEKAKGPSRELDTLIEIAISPDEARMPWSCKGGHVSRLCGDQHWRDGHARKFTASIDAALTLLPEGHDWSLFADNGSAMAGCQPASDDGCDMTDVPGATPALALVAACLKASLLDAASSEAVDQ